MIKNNNIEIIIKKKKKLIKQIKKLQNQINLKACKILDINKILDKVERTKHQFLCCCCEHYSKDVSTEDIEFCDWCLFHLCPIKHDSWCYDFKKQETIK